MYLKLLESDQKEERNQHLDKGKGNYNGEFPDFMTCNLGVQAVPSVVTKSIY